MYQYTEKQLIDKPRTLIFDFLSSQNLERSGTGSIHNPVQYRITSSQSYKAEFHDGHTYTRGPLPIVASRCPRAWIGVGQGREKSLARR